MRKKSILILLGLVFSVTSLAITNQELSSYDLAPGVIPGAGASAQSDEQWDLQFAYDVEGITGDYGCLGVAFDGNYIWVSSRGPGPNPPSIYIFDPEGNLVNQFPVGMSLGGIRDMCFDGIYMFGGRESGLTCFDIVIYQMITTIPFPAGMSFQRANAYDPASDHFYCGNFGSMCYEQDREGNLIRSWPPAPLNAIYGMAWDDDAPDGPWLWIHDQYNPSSGCNVHQMDPSTLTYTGFHISLEIPGCENPIAGGIDYAPDWDPQGMYSILMILGMGTPDMIAGYEMYYVGGQPDLTVTLTPYGTPITIPQWGGEFEFNILLENNGVNPETLDTWTMTTLPNGRVVGPLMGPVNLILLPGETLERDRTQTVPSHAPGGSYNYRAYVGIYPDVVWDLNGFIFSKMLPPGDFKILGWENRGEMFANEQLNIALEPKSDSKLSFAHPNPFNSTAAISFELPQAAQVNLTVFDIFGRIVATLINGWMSEGAHQTLFRADNLASGVYFYRLSVGNFVDTKKMLLIK